MKFTTWLTLFLILLLTACASRQSQDSSAFSFAKHLFDFSQPQTLGLSRPEGLEQQVIFFADELASHFNNGLVLMDFQDQLFMQWQTSARDEDGVDTQVLYTSSEDGLFWREEMLLASVRPGALVTNAGWWADKERLRAFIQVWPKDHDQRATYVEYRVSHDGFRWSSPEPLLMANGEPVRTILGQHPSALSGGRIALPSSQGALATGQLPCGLSYLINTPSELDKLSPLVVSLSKDGQHFTRAFLLGDRSDLPEMKYQGKNKRSGFSHPGSLVWRDYLWVSLAANKEDVVMIRVPVRSLCDVLR